MQLFRLQSSFVLLAAMFATSALVLDTKKSSADEYEGDKHTDDQDPNTPDESDVIDVQSIITDLTNGIRTILAFSMTHSIQLLVSGPNGKDDFEGAYLFDQEPNTFDGHKIKLHQPVKFQKILLALKGHTGTMFFVEDYRNKYLVVIQEKATFALNMVTGKLSKVPLPDGFFQTSIFAVKRPLSSSEVMTFYDFTKLTSVLKFNFGSPSNSFAQSKNVASVGLPFTICTSGSNKIVVTTTGCISAVNWDIQTGFVSPDTVFLFNDKNNLISFPVSAFGPNSNEVTLSQMSTKDFLQVWVPSTTTTTTTLETTTQEPNTLPVVIIVLLIIIIILVICIIVSYCYCYQSNDSEVKPSPKGKSTVVQSKFIPANTGKPIFVFSNDGTMPANKSTIKAVSISQTSPKAKKGKHGKLSANVSPLGNASSSKGSSKK